MHAVDLKFVRIGHDDFISICLVDLSCRQNSRTAIGGFDQPLLPILTESATPPASQGVSYNAHVGIAEPTPDAAKRSTAQRLFAVQGHRSGVPVHGTEGDSPYWNNRRAAGKVHG
jgi:hypothetical protein